MTSFRNKQQAILVAAVVLMLVVSACSLPGLAVSTSPPADVPSPTTPPAPAETPVATEPAAAPTETPVEAQPTEAPTEAPAATPSGGILRQWAVAAAASSEYSNPDWSAQQATGAPDTMECGDVRTAWASETADGVDWLEVTFETAVVPIEISVRETNSPGFVSQIEVRDEMGRLQTVWEGTPGAVEQCPRVLSVQVSGVNVRVNAVRISLDQREGGDWNEIDAVELVGQP